MRVAKVTSCLYSVKDLLIDSPGKEERRLLSADLTPIPRDHFLAEFKRREKSGKLIYEFKAICQNQKVATLSELALKKQNRAKNVSLRVIPYEFNRVCLTCKPGDPSSDYINASWIDMKVTNRRFIAAQGPTSRTVADFWRLIWEHKVHCVVMVTNSFEHARQQCEVYWSKHGADYDGIYVKLEKELSVADYVLRSIRVVHKNGEERVVEQIQFQSWNESDDPSPSTILEVRRQMLLKIRDHPQDMPILVHCSTGSGRTGVFLAVDTLVSKCDQRQPIDVAQVVRYLRENRTHLVAHPQQYVCIYTTLAHHIAWGHTAFTPPDFVRQVQENTMHRSHKNKSAFEEEFERINNFVQPLTVGECAGGHRTENRWKSRNIMLQPPERARPYLLSQDSYDSSDFINAVFVDGYKTRNQYIVSQWPLRNTVNDLWRLISDHNVCVLVVLNDFGEGNRSFPRFWPSERNTNVKYGPITVELEDEFNCSKSVLCRVFKTMRCWVNEHRIPDCTAGFIELIFMSQMWHSAAVRSSPILVISREGVSRAGVFCVASICLDRLFTAQDIDIFHSTELVKRNRPQLVDSLMEYIFIYCAVREMVESFPSLMSPTCCTSQLQGTLMPGLDKHRLESTVRRVLASCTEFDTSNSSTLMMPFSPSSSSTTSPPPPPPPLHSPARSLLQVTSSRILSPELRQASANKPQGLSPLSDRPISDFSPSTSSQFAKAPLSSSAYTLQHHPQQPSPTSITSTRREVDSIPLKSIPCRSPTARTAHLARSDGAELERLQHNIQHRRSHIYASPGDPTVASPRDRDSDPQLYDTLECEPRTPKMLYHTNSLRIPASSRRSHPQHQSHQHSPQAPTFELSSRQHRRAPFLDTYSNFSEMGGVAQNSGTFLGSPQNQTSYQLPSLSQQ